MRRTLADRMGCEIASPPLSTPPLIPVPAQRRRLGQEAPPRRDRHESNNLNATFRSAHYVHHRRNRVRASRASPRHALRGRCLADLNGARIRAGKYDKSRLEHSTRRPSISRQRRTPRSNPHLYRGFTRSATGSPACPKAPRLQTGRFSFNVQVAVRGVQGRRLLKIENAFPARRP